MAGTFTARYRTVCECGERIEPGDEVVWVDGVVEHAECPDDDATEPERDICGGCRMELPASGLCDWCD